MGANGPGGRRSATVGGVPALRVVIADDSLLIREGVARVLDDAGLEVVGRAGDAEELMARRRRRARPTSP